jgi:hypothetical protein
VGLEVLFLVLAAPDGTYIVDVETDWDCPHEFSSAGQEEDDHMISPCSEATFVCAVTRGRETAYEVSGVAEGSELTTELLLLAAYRAVTKQAGMRDG